MLATFMGYIYTMKSELDATVVVIGIQKQLLRADDSQNSTAPPQFFSSAISGKDPCAPNLPKKPNGSVGQGGLEAACPSSHPSTDNPALSRETGGNGRPGSSLPSALQLKPIPGKEPMVLFQKPSEHGGSKPPGLSSPSRCFRADPAQAIGAATLSGGREIGGSRPPSLAPRSNSAIAKHPLAGSQQRWRQKGPVAFRSSFDFQKERTRPAVRLPGKAGQAFIGAFDELRRGVFADVVPSC